MGILKKIKRNIKISKEIRKSDKKGRDKNLPNDGAK
jgi:hypothetical protein